MNPEMTSPDLLVFFCGLLVTGALRARRVRGAILWGIAAATLLAIGLKLSLPLLPEAITSTPTVAKSMLHKQFALASGVLSAPPSLEPTMLKMDLRGALAAPMIPFILIFLFMDLFDTLGTLIGVSEQAGLIKDNKLPRANRALLSDAVGTVAGAAMGTSTVTSFIESASGVERGGRTGLTAVTVAALFLVALFFSPVIAMVGSYPPITAPALVVVGSLMMRNVLKIEWDNYAEALPTFLIIIGIPMFNSIADGLALGFVAYPLVKLLAGQGREVRWLMYVMAVVLVLYFVFIRAQVG
jgi:AGZA family xanthine/uracil permease-like MFS transporter